MLEKIQSHGIKEHNEYLIGIAKATLRFAFTPHEINVIYSLSNKPAHLVQNKTGITE